MVNQDELNAIVSLVESLPSEYRLKAFELLLANHLGESTSHSDKNHKKESTNTADYSEPKAATKTYTLPIDVKAFLTQYKVSEEDLWNLFHREDTEIRPIYTLKADKKARKQIECALMLSLESAIKNGTFQVDMEVLRDVCKDVGIYDQANFMKNLNNNAKFFKAISNESPLALSPEGKSELAELMESLTKH